MNRVTRLMHKAQFQTRHRLAIVYSHKYVITAEDLVKPHESENILVNIETEAEKAELLKRLAGQYSTMADNEIDRRIFY